ncbi:MAG: DMT family transporter [Alphaproteobacteria bacterium]|nr:DMT family transporter [Alphaproteobacteria bacterium]MCB9930994.1 DMT family transporter [Alphaproteobacteria bacterium]
MPIAAPPKDRVLQGILLMCLAVLCFSTLNASAKLLSAAGFDMRQVVWARYIGSLVVMVLIFFPRHRMRLFRPRHLGIQTLRGLLLFGSSALYFQGLAHADLSLAATISITSPLWITALSVPFLGESVGLRRWLAVGVGFIGALVVIRPGMGETNPYILFFVASTTCSTFYALLTRKYAGEENAETSATVATVVGTVAAAPLAYTSWQTPTEPLDIALMCGLGLFAALGHYFFTMAFQRGPAAVIAPFSYGQLVGATAFGYVLFATFPDHWTLIGAAVIMSSGLYIAHRERVRRGR